MVEFKVELVPEERLREHEEVDLRRAEFVRRQILAKGFCARPVAVDRSTFVVLDGHHRLQALRMLGCVRIPVSLVDYGSPQIEVHSWTGRVVSKEQVLRAALTGRRFPPRTTKHMVRLADGSLRHMSCIEPELRYPIQDLRERDTEDPCMRIADPSTPERPGQATKRA